MVVFLVLTAGFFFRFAQQLVIFLLHEGALKPLGFSFLFPEKKKRNKENSPAGTSEAKICTFLSKEKELASLKQLFLLHEQTHKFLHASPLMPEAAGVDVF